MTDFFDIPDMHLVGIKGVAMASLASCLDDRGVRVTGSDIAEDFVTKEILAQRGFKIFTGFNPQNVPKDCGLLIYTGAHQGKNNPEVKEAVKRGIQVMSHAEALGTLMHGKKGISVCGTGGKSTTSSMVSWILDVAGFRPSFAVGVGKVNNFGVSGRYTQIFSQHTDEISLSGWFVAEADEYAVDPTADHRPRFIYQDPKVIIATNLTYDHPDIYPNFEKMKETFYSFFEGDGRFVVANGDSEALSTPRVRSLNSRIFVGTKQHNDFVLKNIQVRDGRSEADLEYNFTGTNLGWTGDKSIHLILHVPGLHNLMNAAFSVIACAAIGVPVDKAVDALEKFTGTMRRFDDKHHYVNMHCFDDYAHTPDEIRATLTALREWEPGKKIVVAFQPHTYSRTKALFDGFVDSLSLADEVILLDIFASARESADPTMRSQLIVDKIGPKARLIPNIDELVNYLPTIAHDEENVFITLGAGDIYKIYDKLKMED